MKKGYKVLIGITICIILIALILQYFRINKLVKQNQIQAVELMLTSDSVKVLTTKNGEIYFKIQSVTIEANALKASLQAMEVDAKNLKSKNVTLGNIVSVLRQELFVQGHDTIPLKDTMVVSNALKIGARKFNWTNSYLSLSGLILNKNLELDYFYRTELTSVTERKGNKSIVTVSLSDPAARIVTGSQIIVVNSKKWWDKWYLYTLLGAGIGIWVAK